MLNLRNREGILNVSLFYLRIIFCKQHSICSDCKSIIPWCGYKYVSSASSIIPSLKIARPRRNHTGCTFFICSSPGYPKTVSICVYDNLITLLRFVFRECHRSVYICSVYRYLLGGPIRYKDIRSIRQKNNRLPSISSIQVTGWYNSPLSIRQCGVEKLRLFVQV